MDNHRMEELAKNLTAARKKSGLSYGKLHGRLSELLGDVAPSDQTIANYHEGVGTFDRVNVIIVAALAHVYGVTVVELSPDLAERLKVARDLLEATSMWFGELAGQAA